MHMCLSSIKMFRCGEGCALNRLIGNQSVGFFFLSRFVSLKWKSLVFTKRLNILNYRVVYYANVGWVLRLAPKPYWLSWRFFNFITTVFKL